LFSIGNIFAADQNGKVIKLSNLPTTTYTQSNCTTSNALQSLGYRVFFAEGYYGGFVIKNIEVDVLVMSQLSIDP
jgi:hypothetical protein